MALFIPYKHVAESDEENEQTSDGELDFLSDKENVDDEPKPKQKRGRPAHHERFPRLAGGYNTNYNGYGYGMTTDSRCFQKSVYM